MSGLFLFLSLFLFSVCSRGFVSAMTARPLRELPTKAGERVQYAKRRTDYGFYLCHLALSVTLARATSPEVRGILSLRRRRKFTLHQQNFTLSRDETSLSAMRKTSPRRIAPLPHTMRIIHGSLREGAAAVGATAVAGGDSSRGGAAGGECVKKSATKP